MAQWDPDKGRLRPTWTVRFTPWATILGCGLAGVLTSVVLVLQLLTGPGLDALNAPELALQGALTLFGAILVISLVVGPTLAWGLGFALRTQTNQFIHVIAFAILGLVLGALFGGFVGIGSLLAPAAGIGCGLARWFLTPFAKI